MNKINLLKELIIKYDGILLSKDLKLQGISRENLRYATKIGLIENVERGVYIAKDYLIDECYILQRKYKNIIFSHETAAYYLGYTTRDPITYCITVYSGHNSKLLSNDSVILYYTKKILEEEIVEVKTMFNRTIYCFSIEKTICDFCSSLFKGDKDVAIEVIKNYASSNNKNINKLMELAYKLKVYESVRKYMEVLL